jgi:hypothetical protein
MQSLKSVLSRKDEQENLNNFLFSLTIVTVLVVSFFGFHAVQFMLHGSSRPDARQIASVQTDPYDRVE